MSILNALLSDEATDKSTGPAGYVVVDLETQRGPNEVGGWVAERMGRRGRDVGPAERFPRVV